ncbi:MAG: hypothetical protein GY778_09190 [bacterium]|nr:hypothetical protein [bacterium]
MRVLPVGISASNLSVFWPLWDAALLRRYGRGPVCSCLWMPWHKSPVRPGPVGMSPMLLALLKRAPAAPVTNDAPSAPAAPLSELDLYWPSEAPVDPQQIIVVERWLREPPINPGRLIDLLF